jgi:signal transduction histidine kinase
VSWKQTIDSVAKLELLNFFHNNPQTMDSAASLAVWAGLERSEVERALEALVESGLVCRTGEIYHYAPPADLAPLVEGAIEAYRSQRAILREELARSARERRRLSQSLRAERRRGEAVLESIREGILVAGPDGIEPLNARARELLPLGPSGPGQAPSGESFRAIERACARPGELVELEAFGHVLRIRATALPADSGAATRTHVLTVYDVTQDVESERLKQDLTRMITHDLRSPASGVSTAFDLLLRPNAEPLSAKQRHIAEVGRRSTHYILGLVGNLLDIGRLEDGHIRLTLGPYHLEDLVEEAIAPLEGLIAERRLTLRRVYPSESRTRVQADHELLVRVLGNLLSNGIKFSAQDGELELRTGRDAEETFVSVRDFGGGIPEAELPRVFEKYYRVAGGKASQVGGTGLGLYFVRLVVEAHGGRVEARNATPCGCRFTVFLPAPDRPSGEPGERPERPRGTRADPDPIQYLPSR